MVHDAPPSQDAFTHQISNLKEYRRYAQDSMQFLESRPEVKLKVTPNLKEYRRYGPDTDGLTDGRTDGQRDYYMPPKVPLEA